MLREVDVIRLSLEDTFPEFEPSTVAAILCFCNNQADHAESVLAAFSRYGVTSVQDIIATLQWGVAEKQRRAPSCRQWWPKDPLSAPRKAKLRPPAPPSHLAMDEVEALAQLLINARSPAIPVPDSQLPSPVNQGNGFRPYLPPALGPSTSSASPQAPLPGPSSSSVPPVAGGTSPAAVQQLLGLLVQNSTTGANGANGHHDNAYNPTQRSHAPPSQLNQINHRHTDHSSDVYAHQFAAPPTPAPPYLGAARSSGLPAVHGDWASQQGRLLWAAVVLTPESRAALAALVPSRHPDGHGSHVTLAYRPTVDALLALPIGAEVAVEVLGEAYDSQLQAVSVLLPHWLPAPTSGNPPHITVSTQPCTPAANAGKMVTEVMVGRGAADAHYRALGERFVLVGHVGVKTVMGDIALTWSQLSRFVTLGERELRQLSARDARMVAAGSGWAWAAAARDQAAPIGLDVAADTNMDQAETPGHAFFTNGRSDLSAELTDKTEPSGGLTNAENQVTHSIRLRGLSPLPRQQAHVQEVSIPPAAAAASGAIEQDRTSRKAGDNAGPSGSSSAAQPPRPRRIKNWKKGTSAGAKDGRQRRAKGEAEGDEDDWQRVQWLSDVGVGDRVLVAPLAAAGGAARRAEGVVAEVVLPDLYQAQGVLVRLDGSDVIGHVIHVTWTPNPRPAPYWTSGSDGSAGEEDVDVASASTARAWGGLEAENSTGVGLSGPDLADVDGLGGVGAGAAVGAAASLLDNGGREGIAAGSVGGVAGDVWADWEAFSVAHGPEVTSAVLEQCGYNIELAVTELRAQHVLDGAWTSPAGLANGKLIASTSAATRSMNPASTSSGVGRAPAATFSNSALPNASGGRSGISGEGVGGAGGHNGREEDELIALALAWDIDASALQQLSLMFPDMGTHALAKALADAGGDLAAIAEALLGASGNASAGAGGKAATTTPAASVGPWAAAEDRAGSAPAPRPSAAHSAGWPSLSVTGDIGGGGGGRGVGGREESEQHKVARLAEVFPDLEPSLALYALRDHGGDVQQACRFLSDALGVSELREGAADGARGALPASVVDSGVLSAQELSALAGVSNGDRGAILQALGLHPVRGSVAAGGQHANSTGAGSATEAARGREVWRRPPQQYYSWGPGDDVSERSTAQAAAGGARSASSVSPPPQRRQAEPPAAAWDSRQGGAALGADGMALGLDLGLGQDVRQSQPLTAQAKERARAVADEARDASFVHQRARNVYLAAAAAAAARGDRGAASALQAKGRAHDAAARELRAKANATAFVAFNAGIVNTHTLDLHGMHVDEAMQVLSNNLACLGALHTGGGVSLRVITGVGRHSLNGRAVIRSAVVRYLTDANYPFNLEPDNPGVVIVRIPTRGLQQQRKG